MTALFAGPAGSTLAGTPRGKAGGLAVAWDRRNGADQGEPLLFDTSVAHCARVYDYWLGGKDNFAADRAAAEQAIRDCPEIVPTVRANRHFLARTVRYLAADAGIRQFLDIGTGIPTENNTHEVAQAVAPGSRVVYVDNDPLVLVHARALLTSHPDGATAYEEADLRDPERILDLAAGLLDFGRPVAVLLLAIMHHIDDEDEPHKIVATLMSAVPPGSYLVLSHPASDIGSEAAAKMAQRLNAVMAEKNTARDRAAVARFFDGLELVAPGLVRVSDWRPPDGSNADFPAAIWAGAARKP
jgi:SAM-dependent methyltransferase